MIAMEEPIFKMKRVGLVGGRPVDAQYMTRITARAERLEAACAPPAPGKRVPAVPVTGAVQLKMFGKVSPSAKKQKRMEGKMVEQANEAIIGKVVWHEITTPPGNIPDADTEVLVYDGYLDDVVKATLEYDSEDAGQWLDIVDGNPLLNPQYWADVPFPDDLFEKPRKCQRK